MTSPNRRGRGSNRAIVVAWLCLLLKATPAWALDANSTMSEWNAASAADQRTVLEAMGPSLTRAFKQEEDEILACLKLAGQSSAHADLPVGEIAKACAEAAEPPSTNSQSNDI